jgi:hypothetical protein
VTVASHPLIFARGRPEFAVNARDYLTLVPVDVNRAGTHALYFYCYLWSTIDKRVAPDETGPLPRIVLTADGRVIPLTPAPGAPADLGLSQYPLPAPADNVQVLVSVTTPEIIRFVADSGDVRVVFERTGLSASYELWDDGRSAMSAFLDEF